MNPNPYLSLVSKQRDEVNAFPIQFAFNQRQYEAALKKLGATHKDDVVHIHAGGIVHKDELDNYMNMFMRHTLEMSEALLDDWFFVEALRYELDNHEYSYTGDPTDAFMALGVDPHAERSQRLLKEARRKTRREENAIN